jgi:DNA-binding NarL/FixJ family response regulator
VQKQQKGIFRMISVAVLEDDEQMQGRLVEILKSWHFVSNVYYADSNLELAKIAADGNIDILLADINVSDGSGIDSVRFFKIRHPNCISIIISSNSNPTVIIEAIKAGATGYLHKDDSKFEIIQAIRSALNGEAPISPAIALTILKSLQEAPDKKPVKSEATRQAILSAREVEIIELISKGMSNDEVGTVLGISRNTVPVHVRNIYRKLGAARRTEAVFEARQLGIIH